MSVIGVEQVAKNKFRKTTKKFALEEISVAGNITGKCKAFS